GYQPAALARDPRRRAAEPRPPLQRPKKYRWHSDSSLLSQRLPDQPRRRRLPEINARHRLLALLQLETPVQRLFEFLNERQLAIRRMNPRRLPHGKAILQELDRHAQALRRRPRSRHTAQ